MQRVKTNINQEVSEMQAVLNVVGRVGTVRVFDGEDGKKTVVFSVAVDQRRNGQAQEGEKPPAVWYSFRANNGIAETLAQHLTKGRLVGVCGVSPRIRAYEVERTLAIQGVGTVRFKDTRQDVEYLLADFRFLDAPPAAQVNQEVVEATVVADEAGQEAAAQPITPDNLPF